MVVDVATFLLVVGLVELGVGVGKAAAAVTYRVVHEYLQELADGYPEYTVLL